MAVKRKIIWILLLVIASIIVFLFVMSDINRTLEKETNNQESTDQELRAELIKINDSITLINDAGESTYYLVCGSEKALMIDTGNGYDDVMAVAKEVTDLPIEVVNTHGHNDHVCGDAFCNEVWISSVDLDLCKQDFHYSSYRSFSDYKNCTLKPLTTGQIFDLGGIELEVVELAGHTPGSIGLLDRKDRILFSGDAVNPYMWLQLNESLPLSQFRKNIGEFMEQYGSEFDYHLCGHTTGLTPKQAIYDLLDGCDEILEGKTQQDEDYQWFGGMGKAHLYGDGNGKQICY